MDTQIIVPVFLPFKKIPRLNRMCIITEKIDGTNASIYIGEDGTFLTGSRTRWITPGKTTDNYGFSAWANENKEELLKLGPGHHFGEWWGAGIQRGYGLKEKKFSLFNTSRWNDKENPPPSCCSVVPVLWLGDFNTAEIDSAVDNLRLTGSIAAPGFTDPEGIVVYHVASKRHFKVTLKEDEKPKGQPE